MFEGSHSLTLDAKHRVTIPTRWRELLVESCDGQLVLTRWMKDCVRVFPLPAWERFREMVQTWEAGPAQWGKAIIQTADRQTIDGAGRILVQVALRKHANLEKRVVLAGDINVLELWDEDRHNAFLESELAAGLPESLKKMVRF